MCFLSGWDEELEKNPSFLHQRDHSGFSGLCTLKGPCFFDSSKSLCNVFFAVKLLNCMTNTNFNLQGVKSKNTEHFI